MGKPKQWLCFAPQQTIEVTRTLALARQLCHICTEPVDVSLLRAFFFEMPRRGTHFALNDTETLRHCEHKSPAQRGANLVTEGPCCPIWPWVKIQIVPPVNIPIPTAID